ncbi:MAG TPA: APC family permease [Anaerolineaceae bacterium]|mgnify:CR=1 FL=1|nr:APC family permease [Anaerolineaceae bacterium]
MNIDDDRGTTVLRRTAEYKPPRSLNTWLIGRPLQTADAPHQTIGKLIGLAVFASDALSSTAYATQEMLAILLLAGIGALQFSIPISIGIVVLLTLLTLSYEQTIHAYPGGGGAYIVARDNLGDVPALVAAASLLTDYILTVSVSISSGVAQVVSAFPAAFPYRVEIAILFIAVVMLLNLRGVKESGKAFAVPTYIFVLLMYATVVTGIIRLVLGTLGVVTAPPQVEIETMQQVSVFLILRAFSNGTSAVTGVEAISNGITAFKEPRSKNAGITLIWMSVILGSLLLGITFLAYHIQAIPSESETVISQLARTVFGGRGFLYIATITATTVILVLAGNTAFAGFPRLSALVAEDGFLPRQLTYRGSRLVYSYGIVLLAVVSGLLVVLFKASVSSLIPLYAIGVFLSFTLSQTGMAVRWKKSGSLKEGVEIQERGSVLRREKGWQHKMVINGIGALVTFTVMIVFAVTKFKDGAWIIILLIPLLVAAFWGIHMHYRGLAKHLSLDNYGSQPYLARNRVIIPIAGVHRGTLEALRYAKTLSDDVTAVHISIDASQAEKVREKWEVWGEGIRLLILESPYRLMVEPLLDYITEIHRQLNPNETITIVVPQFIPKHRWNYLLHTRTADTLRRILLNWPEVVIIEVPYQVD